MSNVLEFIKTETLDKGRVSTTVNLFMIDLPVFDAILLAYVRGEAAIVETREGVAIKHPKDKYDKAVAKKEAISRLSKKRLKILNSYTISGKSYLVLEDGFKIVRYPERVIIVKEKPCTTSA